MDNSNKTLEQLIGERIGMRRTQLEKTQQDIAACCEVKRETINQWENGARQIKAGDLLKLSKALECTADFLTTGAPAINHDMSYLVAQTGLSDSAIENLQRLQALILEKGKFTGDRLDTQDVVNMLLSRDGFFVILAITELFNTPKSKTFLLDAGGEGAEKTIYPVNMWSAALTRVQETLSQAHDKIKRGG